MSGPKRLGIDGLLTISSTSMNPLIEKILNDCDPDIKAAMLETRMVMNAPMHAYALLPDPAAAILAWQAIRETRKAMYLRELNTNFFDEDHEDDEKDGGGAGGILVHAPTH